MRPFNSTTERPCRRLRPGCCLHSYSVRSFHRSHVVRAVPASLAGVVRDEQNLVVPGASVTMAGVENTFSRMVTTDANGTFEFAGLLPGEVQDDGGADRFPAGRDERADGRQPARPARRDAENRWPLAAGRSDHDSCAAPRQRRDGRRGDRSASSGGVASERAAVFGACAARPGRAYVARRTDGRHEPAVLAPGAELRHYDQRRPAELERVSPRWDDQHRSHLQHIRDQPSARLHPRIPDSDRHLHV